MQTNPYNPLGIQWEDCHVIQCRVSQEDFFFLKHRFPYPNGVFDRVLSNLYKKLIDELRRRDQTKRIETALFIDDASWRVLDDVVASFQVMERGTIGEHSSGGDSATQFVSRGTDSIHPEVQRPAEQRTNEEGRPKTRKRSPKGTKKSKE